MQAVVIYFHTLFFSIPGPKTAQSGEFDDLTIEAADITPDGIRTDNGRVN
jgi:hypothetical protein